MILCLFLLISINYLLDGKIIKVHQSLLLKEKNFYDFFIKLLENIKEDIEKYSADFKNKDSVIERINEAIKDIKKDN